MYCFPVFDSKPPILIMIKLLLTYWPIARVAAIDHHLRRVEENSALDISGPFENEKQHAANV